MTEKTSFQVSKKAAQKLRMQAIKEGKKYGELLDEIIEQWIDRRSKDEERNRETD